MRNIFIDILFITAVPFPGTVIANSDLCITNVVEENNQLKFMKEGNCTELDASKILEDIQISFSTESPQTTKPETSRTIESCYEVCQKVINGTIPNQPIGMASRGSVATIFPQFSCNQGIKVYCDCSHEKEAWTVFQRRMNGYVDFFRHVMIYSKGFGSVSKEFWLGLDLIHNFTKAGNYSLKINLKDSVGNKTFAVYSSFSISDSSTNYILKVDGYSGNAGDGLISGRLRDFHNMMPFSSIDRDNDRYIHGNCAYDLRSAWWFNECGESDLNRRYGHRSQDLCWDNVCSFKASEMKFRKK